MTRAPGSGGRRRRGQVARTKVAKGASHVGEQYDVTAGPIAHGGHVVARVDGRAVFVRHALPGELVRVQVTEGTDGDRFWRADAIAVTTPSPDRVAAPCPFSGPGRCGGCDFQHVSLPAQRDLKATVVREQLSRLAKLDVEVTVEAVPGDEDGLRWRTRQSYAAPPPGTSYARGMRLHRSHDVIGIDDCLIAREDARIPGPGVVVERVRGRAFQVAADGFWQVHPGAPETLVGAVLAALEPAAGESVLDLYAGVGLFGAFLDEVGCRVTMVEGDQRASGLSAENVPGAEVVAGEVAAVLSSRPQEHVDLVVLDPPREGARRAVVEQIVQRSPRAVAYVACDPAALARDVAIFAEHGYRLESLRAFDLFPMTHHVECVALLTPAESALLQP